MRLPGTDIGQVQWPDYLIRGVVVDAEGAALESASLTMRVACEDFLPVFAQAQSVAATDIDGRVLSDAEGRFVLSSKTASQVEVEVSKSGYSTSVYRDVAKQSTVRFVLERPVHISGRVILAVGDAPIVGAVVQVMELSGSNGRTMGECATGANGTFVLACAPSRRVVLEVRSTEVSPHARVEVQVARDDVQGLTIVVPAGFPVTGRVVDGDSGAPVPGALVREPSSGEMVKTNEVGGFVFPQVDAVHHSRLEVWAPGYAFTEDYLVTSRTPSGVELLTPVEIRVNRGIDLQGRVMGPRGPVAGARIVALAMDYERSDGSMRTDHSETATGSDGRFVIHGLRNDMRHHAVVQHPMYGWTTRKLPETVYIGLSDVGSIWLRSSVLVAGVVLGDGAVPGGGCEVRIEPALASPEAPDDHVGALLGHRPRTVGRDGVFAFSNVAEGVYKLTSQRANGETVGILAQIVVDCRAPMTKVVLR